MFFFTHMYIHIHTYIHMPLPSHTPSVVTGKIFFSHQDLYYCDDT